MTAVDLPALLARYGVTLADMPGCLSLSQTALRLARDAVLRELVASGMTTGEIAAALALARPSITDRCHRLGITPRHDPGKRRGWVGVKPARTAAVERATPVRLRLVAPTDPWASGVRKADCAELPACEEAWIQAEIARTGKSSGQAWCPRRCAAYVARSG